MVVHAVHQIVPTSKAVEVFTAGQRVWPHESPHELGAAVYRLQPPACNWCVVAVRVCVFAKLYGICGPAVLAKRLCSFAVWQAMLDIHVEVILAESEHELPN